MPVREKRRYVLIKVESTVAVTAEALDAYAKGCVQRFLGIEGLARVKPKLVHFDAEKGAAVFRVARDFVRDFRLSLELAPRTSPLLLRVVKVTGTMRKAVRMISSMPKSSGNE